MLLIKDNVFEVAQNVMSSYSLPLELIDDPYSFFDSSIWTSWVRISGTSSWVVLMTCTAELAVQVAASMNSMEISEITDDIVIDAVGEINNIITGQLKGMLDPVADMSIPEISDGEDYEEIFPDAELLVDLNLRCSGETCKLVLFEG